MAVKTYTIPDKVHPVNSLDLTTDQIESIEAATGVPFNLWGAQGSTMKVLRHVLAAGNGTEPDAFKTKTARELIALVTLDEDEPEAGSPEA